MAAALLAASMAHAWEVPSSAPNAPGESALFFSGGDVWHSGAFVHGGFLWSPAGLSQEGWTFKAFAGAGTYRYRSGALGGVAVTGVQTAAAVMPGWRFKRDKFELTAYAGLDLQDHRLWPDDWSSSVRGAQLGVRAGADLWYEPLAEMMLAANVSASSIGPSYWARLAAGWRAFDLAWLGPELQVQGGLNYEQFRLGLHATALRTGRFEWSMGLGFALDSDRRSGGYARIGVLTRR